MNESSKGWLGPGALRAAAVAIFGALAAIAALVGANPALSASPDCDRLRQAISEASRDSRGAQYQAAAERQRGEIDRTVAYAHSLGCENHKFLFFGSDPPPQCGQVNAQISRMRANLDDLQARAGGGQGGRGEMIARYNAQCGAQQRTPGILDALFGQPKPTDKTEMANLPLEPDPDAPPVEEKPAHLSEARAGGKAVCVRSCDGAFFPVSYSASGGRLDDLQDMCRALCPNADVTLYTYPTSGDIEQAVSITGARYMDSPSALKFRQSFDSSCSCKRRGESWAEALANAETKLGHEQKTDIIVTPEKAAELSRPKVDPKAVDPKAVDPKAKLAKAAAKPAPGADAIPKPAPGTDANGVDTTLSQETQTISRETSGIAGADAPTTDPVGENQGKTIESAGPGGVKRKVRIVGPTL